MRIHHCLTLASLIAPSLHAAVLINDADTYVVSSAIVASEDFDTDHEITPGGGFLSITSAGSLIFNQSYSILNTNGEGALTIDGLLEHGAANANHIYSSLNVNSGGILRSLNSALTLPSDATFHPGSAIEANGGNVTLLGGTLILNGSSISGSSDLILNNGELVVKQNVGPLTGPATGGFSMFGGTAHDFFSVLGGAGLGSLSVDHGTLGSGTIGTAASPNLILRYTGNASKAPDSTLNFYGGLLKNEGTFAHHHLGVIDSDSSEDFGAGSLTNNGTWNLLGEAAIRNSYGQGSFTNNGILQTINGTGDASIWSNFTSADGSEIRTASGSSLTIQGVSVFQSGTTFHSDGDLILGIGNHELRGITLTGNGFLQAGDPDSLGGLLGATSNVRVQFPVGPSLGPATGGFHLNGGTILGSNLGLGGPAFSTLSAARGLFSTGRIGGAILRITNQGIKAPDSEVTISSGILRSEGTFTQKAGGTFDLDPNETSDIYGVIENHGTWNFENRTEIEDSHHEGQFYNFGTIRQTSPDGGTIISTNSSIRKTRSSKQGQAPNFSFSMMELTWKGRPSSQTERSIFMEASILLAVPRLRETASSPWAPAQP